MDKMFDVFVDVVRKAWPGFLVVMTLWLSGTASPGGMFNWAVDSFKYVVVGWVAGWPTIGAMAAQMVDVLVVSLAISFFFGLIALGVSRVMGFFGKDAEGS